MHIDLQVCFVVDIHKPSDEGLLKSQIGDILTDVMNQYPTKSIQIAFVGYAGSFCVTEQRRTHNWTSASNISYLQNHLNTLRGTLMCNSPCRQIQIGYNLANQLHWFARRKIIIHLCDGPAFGLKYHDPNIQDPCPYGHAYLDLETEVSQFATKKIDLVILKLNNNCDKMIEILEKEYIKWSKYGYGIYTVDLTNKVNYRRDTVHTEVKNHVLRQFL